MEAKEKQEERREPHIAVVETPERLAELYRKTGLFGDDVTDDALIDGLRASWGTAACVEYDDKLALFSPLGNFTFELSSNFPDSDANPFGALQLAIQWMFVAGPCLRIVIAAPRGQEQFGPLFGALGFLHEHSTDGQEGGEPRDVYALSLDKWISRPGYGVRMFFVDCYRSGNAPKGYEALDRWAEVYDCPEVRTVH